MLHGELNEVDPEIYALIEKERRRQFVGLELIASEVDDGWISPLTIELYKCSSNASKWFCPDQQIF